MKEDIKELVEGKEQIKSLKNLSLIMPSQNSISYQSIALIAKLLHHLHYLDSLTMNFHFERNQEEEDGIIQLFEGFSKQNMLTALHLGIKKEDLRENQIIALGDSLKKLILLRSLSLNFGNVSIINRTFEQIIYESLKNLQELQSVLVLSNSQRSMTLANLLVNKKKPIEIKYDSSSQKGDHIIAKSEKENQINKVILYLRLEQNISEDGLEILKSAFQSLVNLECFKLIWNLHKQNEQDAKKQLKELISISHLHKLSIQIVKEIQTIWEGKILENSGGLFSHQLELKNLKLVFLRVPLQNIQIDEVEGFTQSLASLKNLEKLKLKFIKSNIEDKSIQLIFLRLKQLTKLRFLQVSFSFQESISENTLNSMQNLALLNCLENLSINFNLITYTKERIVQLSEVLKSLVHLKIISLIFTNNSLEFDNFLLILNCLTYLPSLISLSLVWKQANSYNKKKQSDNKIFSDLIQELQGIRNLKCLVLKLLDNELFPKKLPEFLIYNKLIRLVCCKMNIIF